MVPGTFCLQRTIFDKGGRNLANKIDPRGPFLASNTGPLGQTLGGTSFAITGHHFRVIMRIREGYGQYIIYCRADHKVKYDITFEKKPF